MKLGLQAIDTSDRYYLNYDRRKLSTFISKKGEVVVKTESILSDGKVIELTNAARPDQLPSITFAATALDPDYFKKAAKRIRDLIGTTSVNQAIERLTDNTDIRNWVQTGLEIHKHRDSDACEFCGAQFTPMRQPAPHQCTRAGLHPVVVPTQHRHVAPRMPFLMRCAQQLGHLRGFLVQRRQVDHHRLRPFAAAAHR